MPQPLSRRLTEIITDSKNFMTGIGQSDVQGIVSHT